MLQVKKFTAEYDWKEDDPTVPPGSFLIHYLLSSFYFCPFQWLSGLFLRNNVLGTDFFALFFIFIRYLVYERN
jgi:hypothetical protein